MKKLLLNIALLFVYVNLFANAGVFDGVGYNLSLSKTKDIQMQSEVVRITPLVNDELISGRIENRLWADYKCKFILKNLSNKDVQARIGFPLSSYDVVKNKSLATKERSFKVSSTSLLDNKTKIYDFDYTNTDKEQKFRCLFYWDMNFAPNETLELNVSYKLSGYYGVGSSLKNDDAFFDSNNAMPPYYEIILSEGVSQLFGYVTNTGNSWAGEIENAEFIFDLRNFENKLKRGEVFKFEGVKGDTLKYFSYLISLGQWTRFLNTEFKEVKEGVCVAKFAPFTPRDDFELTYFLSVFPKDINGLDELIEYIETAYKRNSRLSRLYGTFGEEEKQNLADIILAFYGIEVENDSIKDYLKQQHYYKSNFYQPIDETLKTRLLEMRSNGI